MHRRHRLNETSSSANGSQQNHHDAGVLANSGEDPATTTTLTLAKTRAAATTTIPNDNPTTRRRRRYVRKKKKTAFSAFYDGGGPGDDYLILGLTVLLCVLIVVASVLVVQLLQSTNNSSFLSYFGFENVESSGRRTTTVKQSSSNRRKSFGKDNTGRNKPKVPLRPSKIYSIPFSMDHLGDKSDRYAILRKKIDEELPHNPHRSMQRAEELRKQYPSFRSPIERMTETNSGMLASEQPNSVPYDIYNCPPTPPENYPYHWNTLEILKHWPADDTALREEIFQGICVFDYHLEHSKALAYRENEVPFVVRGDPAVASAVERWNHPSYVDQWLGDVEHRTEYSENNHFLYWNNGPPKSGTRGKSQQVFGEGRGTPKDWKEPTQMMRMTYGDWLRHANVTDDKTTKNDPHWYFRLIGCGGTGPLGECDMGSTESLFDELTFFQPKLGQLYLVDIEEQRGIHCRFGMKGKPSILLSKHTSAKRGTIVGYVIVFTSLCLCSYPRFLPSHY
jgi:hypothetical protein